MNERPNSSTRRVCRLRADDPRFAACVLWLNTSTISPPTQQKIREAIFKALDESDEFTTFEEVPDEVRESGVAEEVPRG